MLELAAAALPLALTDFSDMKNVGARHCGNVIHHSGGSRSRRLWKEDWGGLIYERHFVVSLWAFFVWFNDQAVALLKHLGTLVFGG